MPDDKSDARDPVTQHGYERSPTDPVRQHLVRETAEGEPAEPRRVQRGYEEEAPGQERTEADVERESPHEAAGIERERPARRGAASSPAEVERELPPQKGTPGEQG